MPKPPRRRPPLPLTGGAKPTLESVTAARLAAASRRAQLPDPKDEFRIRVFLLEVRVPEGDLTWFVSDILEEITTSGAYEIIDEDWVVAHGSEDL